MRRTTQSSKGPACVASLSLLTLTAAVSLSDFTPREDNLPSACNNTYHTTIPGCSVADFSSSRDTCSKSCLAGLVDINALVSTACANADVDDTSILGLFKLGKAIQLLCNVAVVTTTTGLGSSGGGRNTVTMSASIGSSTMILSSSAPISSGILTDTSAPIRPTMTILTSPRPIPTLASTTSIASVSSSASSLITSSQASKTSSPPASKTSLSPAEEESQRSGNLNSGGGSPFDNINNSSATSLRSIGVSVGASLVAILMGAYLAFG